MIFCLSADAINPAQIGTTSHPKPKGNSNFLNFGGRVYTCDIGCRRRRDVETIMKSKPKGNLSFGSPRCYVGDLGTWCGNKMLL